MTSSSPYRAPLPLKADRGMSCSVVPGMADSTGRRLALAAAAGSKLPDTMVLISVISALHLLLGLSCRSCYSSSAHVDQALSAALQCACWQAYSTAARRCATAELRCAMHAGVTDPHMGLACIMTTGSCRQRPVCWCLCLRAASGYGPVRSLYNAQSTGHVLLGSDLMKADLPTLAAPITYTSLPRRCLRIAAAAALMPCPVRLLTTQVLMGLSRLLAAAACNQSAAAPALLPFGSKSTCTRNV